MSHVAAIKLEIKDLESLAKAAADCGLEFMEGQKHYKWYGRWVQDYHGGDAAYKNGIKPEDYGKCDHAIRIPGDGTAYEIGVVKRADGTFTLIYDFFAQQKLLGMIGGKAAETLTQRYATQVAIRQAKLKGFRVQEKKLANGNVQLVCQR